jgi:hypothetical protein
VTLLFAQDSYERVAEAYIAGLETYVARGGDLKQVASVATTTDGPVQASWRMWSLPLTRESQR